MLFQDLFTKWIEVEPLRAANAKKIMDSFLDIVVTRWGTLEVLHSDNGTVYNNNSVKELAATFGIHHSFSPLYHPHANLIEPTNRILKTIFISFIRDDHQDWDVYINDFSSSIIRPLTTSESWS